MQLGDRGVQEFLDGRLTRTTFASTVPVAAGGSNANLSLDVVDGRHIWEGDAWVPSLVDPLPGEDLMVCVGPASMYTAALYWAVMTITSIGFGDLSATPRRRPFEQAIAIVIMLISALAWAQVVATLTPQVMAAMAPAQNEFHITMDNLSGFMKGYQIPIEMQVRLREYFRRTQHLQLGCEP